MARAHAVVRREPAAVERRRVERAADRGPASPGMPRYLAAAQRASSAGDAGPAQAPLQQARALADGPVDGPLATTTAASAAPVGAQTAAPWSVPPGETGLQPVISATNPTAAAAPAAASAPGTAGAPAASAPGTADAPAARPNVDDTEPVAALHEPAEDTPAPQAITTAAAVRDGPRETTRADRAERAPGAAAGGNTATPPATTATPPAASAPTLAAGAEPAATATAHAADAAGGPAAGAPRAVRAEAAATAEAGPTATPTPAEDEPVTDLSAPAEEVPAPPGSAPAGAAGDGPPDIPTPERAGRASAAPAAGAAAQPAAESRAGETAAAAGAAPPAVDAVAETPVPSSRRDVAVNFAAADDNSLAPAEPGEPAEAHTQRVLQSRNDYSADRAYAVGRLQDFHGRQADHIASLMHGLPAHELALDSAADDAAGQITEAAAAQGQSLRADVARAKAQAHNAARAANANIRASHAGTVAGIRAATQGARVQLAASYAQALASVAPAEATQLANVARLYEQAAGAFRAAATAAGAHAMRLATGRTAAYRAQRINREDSFLDGSYTDNRCEARAEAAERAGEGYRAELATEGENQVVAMRQRLPEDESAVRGVIQQGRSQLATAYQESLSSLDQSREQALSHAAGALQGALAGTARTLRQTVVALRRHQAAQLDAIETGAGQSLQALRERAATGKGQLRTALATAVSGLTTSLDQSAAAMDGTEVPDRAALDETIASADAALSAQAETVRTKVLAGRDQLVVATADAAAASLQTLAETGQAASAVARDTGEGASQALAQAGAAGAASLQQILATQQNSCDGSVAAAAQGNTSIVTGIGLACADLSARLQGGMQSNADAVRLGLTEVVDRNLDTTITTEASAAADQVKPRWQSVLKWVIIIAIILVVAIVLGPMVIGAVTGLAAGLGASTAVAGVVGAVVGGAIVGAGTAAVTTVVQNAFAGRRGWELFDGVGTAMAWGALGGALGGGASALLAGPMQAMGAAARIALQTGVDMALDTTLSALSGNLSLENFATSLALSVLVTGVSSHPRVRMTSERFMSRGYGAGFEGGVGLRGRFSGATPPGPVSISGPMMEHVARGDTSPPTSPNAGKWNVKGGGHVPGEILPRADAEAVPHTTRATDPVTGVSIEQFTRPSGSTTDKSLFPPSTTRAHVDAMGETGLSRALSGDPGSSLTPPTSPTSNGRFRAVVRGPDGHPILVEGFYRPDGAGGYTIQSVYPSTNLGAGTVPVVGGTGLGGSRTLPMPAYATPPQVEEERP